MQRAGTTLSDAAGGDTCPTWDTVVAYVSACGGTAVEWRLRWEHAHSWANGVSSTTPEERPDAPRTHLDDELEHLDDEGHGLAETTTIPTAIATTGHDAQRRWRWWAAVFVVASSVAAAGALAVWTAPDPVKVSGSVTCTNGANVVGVWVKAADGGSGFASYTHQGGPDRARYSYTLPRGGAWMVNVGCGGGTQAWRDEVTGTTFTSSTEQDWRCSPSSGPGAYGCEPREG